MSCRALLFLFSLFLRLAEFLDGAVGVEEAQLSSFAEVADCGPFVLHRAVRAPGQNHHGQVLRLLD